MNKIFYSVMIFVLLFSFELFSKELAEETLTTLKSDEPESVKKDKIGFFSIIGKKENIDNPWTIILPLSELLADENVKAVILALDEIPCREEVGLLACKYLKQLREAYKKPIIAYGHQNLCYTAYLIGCGADIILASRFADVGGIGYCWNNTYRNKRHEKKGDVLHVFSSGKFGLLANENCEPKKEDLAFIESLVKSNFDTIVNTVMSTRPKMGLNQNKWIDGNCFDAQAGLESGIIDGIVDRVDLVGYALKLSGCSQIDINTIGFDVKTSSPSISFEHSISNRPTTVIIEITDESISHWQDAEKLLSAFQDKNVDKIILHIRTIHKMDYNLYDDIIKLKNIYNKPIIAYIDYASSFSSYYIAMATDYIIASPGAHIIGASSFIRLWDYSENNKKNKLEYIPMYSGKLYGLYDNNLPMNIERKELFQKKVNDQYAALVKEIKVRRPLLNDIDESLWAEGQLFAAYDALRIGLIDAIGSPLDALNFGNETVNNKVHELSFMFKAAPQKSKD